MFNFFGILGAILFALCSLPQVAKCISEGHASGLSWGFIFMGIGGNVFSAIYLAWSDSLSGFWHYPMYANYGAAFILCVVLLALKIRDLVRGVPNFRLKKITIRRNENNENE